MLSCAKNNYEAVPYEEIQKIIMELNYMYLTTGTIDVNKLDVNKVIKGYDGYIGPNGEFYKVSVMHEHHPSHEEWAFNYIHDRLDDYALDVRKHIGQILKYKDDSGLLTHRYGFICYSHSQYGPRKPGIVFPFDDERNITDRQRDTFKLLLYLNDPRYFNEFFDNYNGHSFINGHELYRIDEFKKYRLKGYKR